MATKIQINSLEALERLIGGDSQLEVEVRNSIVQDFCKKYLKGVADETIVAAAKESIKLHVEKDYLKQITVGNWGRKEFILNDSMASHVIKLSSKTINDSIDKAIKEGLYAESIKGKIEKRIEVIDLAIKNELDTLVGLSLKLKIGDLVDAEIKRRMLL